MADHNILVKYKKVHESTGASTTFKSSTLRLDFFDRQTSTTKVEVGVEDRFYVIEYLSIIRETQG